MAPACFAPSLALGAPRVRLHPSLTKAAPAALPASHIPLRRPPRMVWGSPVPVPDFTDWENQGAGLAFANLSGLGDADLITLHVDNPNEQNAGHYRIARGLRRTAEGTYSIESWGPTLNVPGWVSWENQGAGVAVADINDRGGPNDLVVLHMDNPTQQNRPYYIIGFDLDEDGRDTGGWTDMIPIPGDFGWETQGAGVDVASISSPTSKDLVVFYIDNPKEKNAGYYRIGFDMDPEGHVRGNWSDPMKVPNWDSWENQGGGAAVYDTTGNGKLDIVVFFIDNPTGRNKAYYTVGHDLNAEGKVTGNWSEPKEIPGWTSWENQGGGIAAYGFPDATSASVSPTLGIYYIDNPRGQNKAYLRFGDNVL